MPIDSLLSVPKLKWILQRHACCAHQAVNADKRRVSLLHHKPASRHPHETFRRQSSGRYTESLSL